MRDDGPSDPTFLNPDTGDFPTGTGTGEQVGEMIDRYKLLEEIGEGGMGTVWLAEQEEPVRRRVALKVIKLGMDTKEVVVRFEAERQALALMEHPCIARALDGGATAAGRPYFVMELVKGTPITDYCDRARVSVKRRLELFVQVCEAIQHAHQKGVIHRDIKPSNVLVTVRDDVPVPKVIDFGIAKATSAELTQKTIFTQHACIVGTPEYMAPEQADVTSLDIDTRADVYSLGVLLYELLTGTKPFEMATVITGGFDELLRTIREVDPDKPSTRISSLGDDATPVAASRGAEVAEIQKRLRGDLDWIVMKALEKERSRRYETAAAFGEDVERYLRDEPVEAVPPSAGYRMRKFVRRRRKTVIAATAMLLLLIAGAVGTGIGWMRALRANAALDAALGEKQTALEQEEQQRVRAETAEREANERAEALETVVAFQAQRLEELDIPSMAYHLRAAMLEACPEEGREALSKALEPLNFTDLTLGSLRRGLFGPMAVAIREELGDQPLIEAHLLQTLSTLLRGFSLFAEAEEPQRRALAIRREVLGNEDPLTLTSLNEMAELLGLSGRAEEARPLYVEAFANADPAAR